MLRLASLIMLSSSYRAMPDPALAGPSTRPAATPARPPRGASARAGRRYYHSTTIHATRAPAGLRRPGRGARPGGDTGTVEGARYGSSDAPPDGNRHP